MIDLSAMQSYIQGLKTLGLYDNLLAGWDARFGVKLDGSNYASKWYDISSYNRDAAQGTGSAQPLWNATSGIDGRAGLYFDGNDSYAFSGCVPSTIIITINAPSQANTRYLIGGYTNTNAMVIAITGTNVGDRALQVRTSGNPSVTLLQSDAGVVPLDHCTIAVTIDRNDSNLTKGYVDGELVMSGSLAQTLSANVLYIAYMFVTVNYAIGHYSNSMVFDTPLTQTQIQTISAL